MTNIVYVGTSLDGRISGRGGDLKWLEYVPIPANDDLGFAEFMARVDAVVMGRKTFETLVGFDVGWHYPIPGIVLSSTLTSVPQAFAEQVQIADRSPAEMVELANELGYRNLYIDGGVTVQRFLDADLIDEMIITEIPVVLGDGARLFGDLEKMLGFELVASEVLAQQLLRKHYRRKRV